MKRGAGQSREDERARPMPRAEAQARIKVTDADFRRIMVLGRGAYAKVVLVEDRRTRKLYAMKILNKNHIVQKQQAEHTMTERHILSCTSTHPFVCHLKFAFRTETTLNLVMDYCPGGELFYHLSREGSFDETRARFIAAELTLALGHLHSNSVVYRDLKPENILIDADGHIKLADFGLSKEGILNVASGAHTFCGTPEYLAPEVLLRKGHGTAVDWWSLGALLYEMLTGLPPWYSLNRKEMYYGITHGELLFPDKVSPLARSIISLLLEKDPVKRLGSKSGVHEVKAHPFFADIDWQALLEKRYVAPWIPPKTAIEGMYFDPTYTQQPVLNSVTNPSALAQSQFPDFAGFSWNAPGAYQDIASSVASVGRMPIGSPPPMNHVATNGFSSFEDEGIVQVRDRIESNDAEDLAEESEEDGGIAGNGRQSSNGGGQGEDAMLFDIEMDDQQQLDVCDQQPSNQLPPTPMKKKSANRRKDRDQDKNE